MWRKFFASYVVPEHYEIPDLNNPGRVLAGAGDILVLRPSHPTAPLSVVRHVRHGYYPMILSHLDYLECVEVSSGVHPEEVMAALLRVSGQPDPLGQSFPPPPARPVLHLVE